MSDFINIKVKKLPHFPLDSKLEYATQFSSGIDLIASVKGDVTLNPFERKIIESGISLELPEGFEAQVRSRSGLALKNGIAVLNSPGTIDNDYRGEIKIILINLGNEPVIISRGMRVAQLVFARVQQALLVEVEELSQTQRNDGGFGSTGC